MAKGAESNELDNGVTPICWRSEGWDQVRSEFADAQAGQCPICERELGDRPHLDHCHQTGFIRGTLCSSCNGKLGWYEKRRHAIEAYLARSGEFQAYQLATRPKAERIALGIKDRTRRDTMDWLRRYWQEKGKREGR